MIDVASIKGLPEQSHTVEGKALAVKRFDRLQDGAPVHMEDFAPRFSRCDRQRSTDDWHYADVHHVPGYKMASSFALIDTSQFQNLGPF